ncbi:response regulator [Alphaproteobacteria bacterium KMM 3653]|uniref:histidine kinase n=1 Tax=Harenicola maris TaxID=2841044 RepID=A0AAP2G7S5_9RHOB|nr:response regulator [Harenicola maris]
MIFQGLFVLGWNTLILHHSDPRITIVYILSAVAAGFFWVNRRVLYRWSSTIFCLFLVGFFSFGLEAVGGNLRFPAFPFFYVLFLGCALAAPLRGVLVMGAAILAAIVFFGLNEIRTGVLALPKMNAIMITHLMVFTMLMIVALTTKWAERLRRAAQDGVEARSVDLEEKSRALLASEERLTLATRQLSIWDWDVKSDALYLSPSFARMLGYSEEELREAMAGTTANLLHPDELEDYRQNLQAHFEDPSKPFVGEYRYLTKSGETRWFLSLGESEVDESGKAVRFTGSSKDVTERRQLEDELRHSQKMEAIGKVTGGVAHDFNNLLAVVLGNFELIKEASDEEEVQRLADAGIKATMRGADLTRNMLSFARKSRLKPKILNLNAVLQETQSWFLKGVPSNVRVKIGFAPDLNVIRADPSMTQTALLNILFNACDAMPEGGTLWVSASNEVVAEELPAAGAEKLSPGRYVRLMVADDGHGISAEHLEQIIEPFFTTKPVGAGSGLGLSMVQGFMKQSGGALVISSSPNHGTAVSLYFPVVEGEAASIAPAPRAQVMPRGRARILVVEDQREVLTVLVQTLSKEGYEVLQAENGDIAVEILASGTKVDLVLSDIAMPGKVQGTDLAARLREDQPELPVILMSGFAQTDGKAQELGAARLTKPVTKELLLRAIEQALEGAAG